MRRILGLLVVLLGVALLPAVPAAAGTGTGTGTGTGETVVVRFRPGTTPTERSQALAARGLTVVDAIPGGDHVLARADGAPAGYRAASAAGGPVAAVEAPVRFRAHAAPDDPYYPAQWNLPLVQAEPAWAVTTGTGVVVAVLDTGVAYQDRDVYRRAPDLAGTRFVAGYDFVNGDAYPNDDHGHGTHVTGTIAQTTNNGLGVAGLAPGASIMPLKVLGADGGGSDWDIAQALRFAADRGVDVANLSLGAETPSSVLADAVRYAASQGVVIVASSGNEGVATVSYPAAYPEVIAVGAVRRDLARPAYANTGAALDLVAPGGDLRTDFDGDGNPDGILQQTLLPPSTSQFCWCLYQGTSMAAPHVSAAAALVIASGATDPTVVRQALETSARDLGPSGWDSTFGHGLVQARAAIDAAALLGSVGSTEPATPPAEDTGTTEPTEPVAGAARSIEPACPTGTVPSVPFLDVALDSTHAPPIACVVWWQVANGVSATSYRPAGTVSREQMASFVARLIEAAGHVLPASPPDAFPDDGASTHHLRINQLAAVGVVSGTADGRYNPGGAVNRGQMATFLVRAHDLLDAGSPLTASRDWFSDDAGLVHEPAINKAADAGLAAGTGPGTFSPGHPVRRDQMASFVARTLSLLVTDGVAAAR